MDVGTDGGKQSTGPVPLVSDPLKTSVGIGKLA